MSSNQTNQAEFLKNIFSSPPPVNVVLSKPTDNKKDGSKITYFFAQHQNSNVQKPKQTSSKNIVKQSAPASTGAKAEEKKGIFNSEGIQGQEMPKQQRHKDAITISNDDQDILRSEIDDKKPLIKQQIAAKKQPGVEKTMSMKEQESAGLSSQEDIKKRVAKQQEKQAITKKPNLQNEDLSMQDDEKKILQLEATQKKPQATSKKNQRFLGPQQNRQRFTSSVEIKPEQKQEYQKKSERKPMKKQQSQRIPSEQRQNQTEKANESKPAKQNQDLMMSDEQQPKQAENENKSNQTLNQLKGDRSATAIKNKAELGPEPKHKQGQQQPNKANPAKELALHPASKVSQKSQLKPTAIVQPKARQKQQEFKPAQLEQKQPQDPKMDSDQQILMQSQRENSSGATQNKDLQSVAVAPAKPTDKKQQSPSPLKQNKVEAQIKDSLGIKPKNNNDDPMQMQSDEQILNGDRKSCPKQEERDKQLKQEEIQRPPLQQGYAGNQGAEALQFVVNNRQMKEFYYGQVQNLPEGEVGPLVLRYAVTQQKYLNQLRVLIQLNGISNQELRLYQFDKQEYRLLVQQKTKTFQQNTFPKLISQQLLSTPALAGALDQLQNTDLKLSAHESKFDQQYIKGLYKFPSQLLMKTKQELFQESLNNQIEELQANYKKLKEDCQNLATILKQKQQLLENQKKMQVEAKRKNQLTLEKQKLESQELLFPGQKQSKQEQKFEQDTIKVILIRNKEELEMKFQELKDDSELAATKQELHSLMKQRNSEEELFSKQKEKYEKNRSEKKGLSKKVYMGDAQKMKTHPKIVKLEKELKLLAKEWQQKQEARQGSHVIPGSAIRLISTIDY